MSRWELLPIDLVKNILSYDGRIKYRLGAYIDIIHKYDFRYAMLKLVIEKKLQILSAATIHPDSRDVFYFEFNFDDMPEMGLCYDTGFSNPGRFCIYYFKMTNDWPALTMTEI